MRKYTWRKKIQDKYTKGNICAAIDGEIELRSDSSKCDKTTRGSCKIRHKTHLINDTKALNKQHEAHSTNHMYFSTNGA